MRARGSWFRRRGANGRREVILYTRVGCHLCDEARRQLAERQTQNDFLLKIVHVDGDSDLVERYGDRVPVVLVDGKERFFGRINPVLLDRLFRTP